jgi:hypothetical protein
LEVAALAAFLKFTISSSGVRDTNTCLLVTDVLSSDAAHAKRFVIKQNKKQGVKEVVIKIPDAEIIILRDAIA